MFQSTHPRGVRQYSLGSSFPPGQIWLFREWAKGGLFAATTYTIEQRKTPQLQPPRNA